MDNNTLKLPLFIYLLTSPFFSISQNLIPNPGFEVYNECPITNYHYSDASSWYTNVEKPINTNFEWHERAYIHACDQQVQPWWGEELGDGLIRTMFGYDVTNRYSTTQVIWTELLAELEKDSLYYIEYVTAPSLLFYPEDSSFELQRSVPFNLGIKFENESFDGVINELDSIEADQYASECGIGYKIPNALQFGNCFKASGDERYFLYGFFLDYTPIEEYSFLGSSFGNPIKWPIFTSDNFILEKMKLEICSDTTVCEMENINFSSYIDTYVLPEKKITWNDGIEGLNRSFKTSGKYRFKLISVCGEIWSNWVNIETQNCSINVYVPNVFSPNGDQINAIFAPQLSGNVDIIEIQFTIFNRWGHRVFQSSSPEALGWDGNIDGVEAAQDTYVWMLEYTYIDGSQNTTQRETGDLLLLR